MATLKMYLLFQYIHYLITTQFAMRTVKMDDHFIFIDVLFFADRNTTDKQKLVESQQSCLNCYDILFMILFFSFFSFCS